MPTITPDTSVGQLVAERPSRSRIFERLGIDYCCGGHRSLADACRKRGLDPDTVALVLDTASEAEPTADTKDWTKVPLGDLIDHIETNHHAFLRRELPRLDRLLTKVARVHGTNAPWIVAVKDVFDALRPDLEAHLAKEETVVFPLINALAAGDPLPDTAALDGDPLRLMEEEHDEAGAALERLRTLSDGYTPPEGACASFRAVLDGLRQLEADMHQHVHKENNVLFPRARALGRLER